MLRNYVAFFLALFAASTLLTSCEAIGSIFKAGVWTGLLLVAVVIAVIIFIISRFRR